MQSFSSNIFQALAIPNQKGGAELLREWSSYTCVMCHVSHITCHMSPVTCHLYFFYFFYLKFFLQSVAASRWRVCYQQGIPHLFY